MSKYVEVGSETKLGPELAHMTFDINNIQPFSEKKADGSAARYMKITPPPDGTYSRGDVDYSERLNLDFYPLKPAEFVPHEQGIGVVSYLKPIFGNTVHAESRFGLAGLWGWRARQPWNDRVIETTGGIRPEARAMYQKNFLTPFIAGFTLSMAAAVAAQFYVNTWRSVIFMPPPKYLGYPGCVAILGALAYSRGKSAGAYEADFRRLEEARHYKGVMHDRAEQQKDAWAEHKGDNEGWWSKK